MIAEQLIKDVKDNIKIEKVIGERIALKRAGSNFKGCCPFHNEVTESFMVSPVKRFYKCFGCGAGCDAIEFVQRIDNMSFPEALKKVAKMCNIDIPERELTPEEQAAYKKRESALDALEKQNKTFREGFMEHQPAKEWLTNERGIKPETIEKWGLGYAPSDFFAGRVTYPLRNVAGEICGFTGRILNAGGEQSKFKNCAENDLFKKSDLLFGLYHAKMKINAQKRCYIVEGQHDVLQMVQLGYENIVAPSGTAITASQIEHIKRWTTNIVLLLDGDTPGIKAALKNISPFLAAQVNLRIIVLPTGEDPDSYIRKTKPDVAIQFINNGENDFIQSSAL